tara:strand:+ start:43 stop:1275 length:1233 start_codon:yes stop_codon:yes gene_type:complete
MKHGIVFDMDKCIGFFTQVAVFHDILEELSRPLKTKEYFDLFDMCPEIFRPGIFKVFKYLSKIKKKTKSKVIIYTNNNGPPSWATNIRKYIEYKIKKKLFDRTIKGWKYNNKIVEKNREGYAKSWKDLLKCTSLNKHDKIIFFDDREEHDKMRHKNVNYQLVKPYKVKIEYKTFINRFMKSKLKRKLGNKITRDELEKALLDDGYIPNVLTRKYSNDDIMKPLVEFMKKNKKKTRKRIKRKVKKTRKGGRKYTLKQVANTLRAPMVLRDTRTQTWVNLLTPRDRIRLRGYIQRQRREMNRNGIPEDEQDQITAEWLNEVSERDIAIIQQAIRNNNERRAIQHLARRIRIRIERERRDEARRQQEQEEERREERTITPTPRETHFVPIPPNYVDDEEAYGDGQSQGTQTDE